MRAAIIIIGGIILLGLFALAGWWLGGGPKSTMTAAKLFIAVWLAVALINMWFGLSSGYSVAEELPIFLVIFAIPAIAAAFIWWRFS